MGELLPDVVRWTSWGYWNFVRACDRVHFERVTKQRYGIGPARPDLVELGLNEFVSSAAIFWNSISARRTGSSESTSPMLISVWRASCRSLTSPACRSRIFRASSVACAADGYPGLAGSVRGARRA